MHRTIEMIVPPSATDTLCRALQRLEHVTGLSIHPGASLKPVGDVVVVHGLNRGADEVLQCVQGARGDGAVSIVTAELASMIDPQHEYAVDHDVDEAIWEEMETGLRHQGRVTPNYLALMALGGAIATIGLVSEPAAQLLQRIEHWLDAPMLVRRHPLSPALRAVVENWRRLDAAVH